MFVDGTGIPPTPHKFSFTCAFGGEYVTNDTTVCDKCVFQLRRGFEESGADPIGGRVLGAVFQECIGSNEEGRKV